MTTETVPAADANLQAMAISLQGKMARKCLNFHGFCDQYGARSEIAEAFVRDGLHRTCLRIGKPDWIDARAKPDQGSLDWGKKHFLDDMAKRAINSPDSPPRHMVEWTNAEWAFAKALFLETLADYRKARDAKAARDKLLKNPLVQSAAALVVAGAIYLIKG